MNRVEALYEQSKALSKICAKMYAAGLLVDEAARRTLSADLQKQYEAHVWDLHTLVNIEGFTCNPNDMRALIYRRHENERVKRFSLPDPYNPRLWSSEKTISVDEKSLMSLVVDTDTPKELIPIIDMYWKAQSARKARSTFLESELVLQAIGRDGRLRPGWNSLGTETGRFSCSEPNVMTLPKKLRRMFAAPTGRVFIHADFSQLELRVMAAVSGDTALWDALRSGDVYVYMAKRMFNLPEHLVKCECTGTCASPATHLKSGARKAAKVISLAAQYAAGLPQVYSQYLLEDRKGTWKNVRQMFEAWRALRKGTLEYWDAEWKRVQDTGYSESRIMRRRQTYPAEPTLNAVVNYPIQSTAADIMNAAFIETDAALPHTASLVAQQHDAMTIECNEDDAFKVMNIVDECMSKPRMIEGALTSFPVDVVCTVTLDQT